MNLPQILRTTSRFVQKNSPIIFTVLNAVGVLGTSILAIQGHSKAQKKILDVYWGEETEELTFKDRFVLTWHYYIPAVLSGGFTIGCAIGAQTINTRRQSALASAYALSEVALKSYQEKVVEMLGKGKHKKITDGINQDIITKNPPPKDIVIIAGKEALCFDVFSGRYFKSDIETIRQTVNRLNKKMFSDMYISLNEFYSELGLETILAGEDCGWDINHNGLIDVSFGSTITEDGQPCIVLNYEAQPRYID